MLLSIVVPFYNEESGAREFYNRLRRALEAVAHADFELLFVNDGSSDRTLEILEGLAGIDPEVRVIDFSRNFGHQAAIYAGIRHARGDAVVIIDSDLQDPPELIPQMVEKWLQGFQVVYARRTQREGEKPLKKLTAFLFYRLINLLSEVEIPRDVGDFRLIDRKVVSVLKRSRERNLFIRGLIAWAGFRQVSIPYHRDRRFAGETKYSLPRMFNFAFDGISSFSIKPLRISLAVGLVCILIGIGLVVYTLIMKYVYPETVITGWTSLLITIIFFGGVQLLTIGVVGEYVGKIYRETKGRPRYIVNRKIGFERRRDAEKGPGRSTG